MQLPKMKKLDGFPNSDDTAARGRYSLILQNKANTRKQIQVSM